MINCVAAIRAHIGVMHAERSDWRQVSANEAPIHLPLLCVSLCVFSEDYVFVINLFLCEGHADFLHTVPPPSTDVRMRVFPPLKALEGASRTDLSCSGWFSLLLHLLIR